MDRLVRITFSDGTVIEAMLNATTFIVDSKPDFPADLTELAVEEVETGRETIYHNAKITEAYSDDGRYRFGITEIPAEVIAKEKMDAQTLYTALMTDTLLEEV